MSRTDRIALLLSLLAVLAAYFIVADNVFERIPHIEDEMAFVWQARLFAGGEATIPSPPSYQSVFVPFVVDYQGERFGKYPPGWPAMLSLGIRLGIRAWVNPLLAGLAVWLTYRLGQKILSARIGLLAALLTTTSPFFLINAGSLLSHSWSLALSLIFSLAWLDTFQVHAQHQNVSEIPTQKQPPAWLTVLVAGLSLGLLAITRPLTALGVAAPFFIHGLILLIRGSHLIRIRVLVLGGLAALVSSILFAWQYAATGDALLNPYVLWWPYDKIGFGPGFGRQDGGHSLYWAVRNLGSSMYIGCADFFGWGNFSWLFLPFGLFALRRRSAAWLPISVFTSLVVFYMLYWVTSNVTGPRYYYEGFFSISLLSSAGIFWLAGKWQRTRLSRLRFALTGVLVLLLIGYNVLAYLPERLEAMHSLYGVEKADLDPFLTPQAQSITPALVIVHVRETWTDYGALLDLEDPWLSTPFIFAMSRTGAENALLADRYPGRRIFHYYPGQPFPPEPAP